jgi:hypothetical protein
MANDVDKMTITLKGDGAPWIVIHAASPEEAEELLDAVPTLGAKAVEAALNFKSVVSDSYPARGNAGRSGGQPQAQATGSTDLTHVIYIDYNDSQGRQAIKDAAGKGDDGNTRARWDKERKGWKVPAYVVEKFPGYKSEPL